MGWHRAQPLDDLCRHGRHDERARGGRAAGGTRHDLLARRPGRLGQLVEAPVSSTSPSAEIAITFRADDIDAHIARVSSLAGPLAGILRRATVEQRAAVRRTASDLAAPFLTDDGLAMPGHALLVSGARPS